MHFVTTGVSSLLALIMMVVFHYKTTKEIPDDLATAFKRVRLNIYFNATADEIVMLGQSDNIEQHERKRHTEIDNILAVAAWCQSMGVWSSVLNPKNALDVVRYAVCLADPRRPSDIPAWMTAELKGKLPTMANRIAALTGKGITKRWLSDRKANPCHPQMNSYAAVAARHRFLRGFNPDALDDLYRLLYCRMGEQGLAHKQAPISKASLNLNPAEQLNTQPTNSQLLAPVPLYRCHSAGGPQRPQHPEQRSLLQHE